MGTMNVADLELCKELFELSGWETKRWYYRVPTLNGTRQRRQKIAPKYDLEFLLRKLPPTFKLYKRANGAYKIDYLYQITAVGEADTPENATIKLCIELFKSGVLKRKVEE